MEKQNITNKIISDAEVKGLEIISNAHSKADNIKAEAKTACEEARAVQNANLTARGEEILKRREINARLDSNKTILSAKCQVLDGVFERALEKLCALPETEYIAFINSLLVKYAEQGDTVVLSSKCTFRDKISALPVISEKNVTVEKAGGEFAGGVILIGKECDKNLTFEAFIQSAKDEKQAEIASRLFG